jgi:cell division septation protein DedD
MASSQDTEITLGTAKLLGLFFSLVVICAVFFALGYSLGRKADPGISASAAGTPPASAAVKPGNAAAADAPMTFYKAVEQKDANAQLTPTPGDSPAGGVSPAGETAEGQPTPGEAAKTPPSADPVAAAPAGAGYFVQVAAVSKQDDAAALVDALKNKQYPAFVAGSSATDKLFRVQVGPFSDIKEAEAMRTRLVGDGYNPILKK